MLTKPSCNMLFWKIASNVGWSVAYLFLFRIIQMIVIFVFSLALLFRKTFPQERGVPQGCILSVTVFSIKIDWGSGRNTLLVLYTAIPLSKLDHGSISYVSARPSYLRPRDSIHHKGLRSCLGAYRTSLFESLYVGSNDLPLWFGNTHMNLRSLLFLQMPPLPCGHSVILAPRTP